MTKKKTISGGAGTNATNDGQPAAQPAADQPEYVTQILQQLRDLTNKVNGLDDKINAEHAAQNVVKQQNDVKTYLEGRVAKTPKDKKNIYDNACAAAKLTGDIKYTTIDGLFKQDLNDEQKITYDAIPEAERRKWIDGLYATAAPATGSVGKGKLNTPKVISGNKKVYKVSSMFSNYSIQLKEQALLYDAAGGVETVKEKVWTKDEKAKGNDFNATNASHVAKLALEAVLAVPEDDRDGLPLKQTARARLRELVAVEMFNAYMHPEDVKEARETIGKYYDERMKKIIGSDDVFCNENDARDTFETYLRMGTVKKDLFNGKVPKKDRKVNKGIERAAKSMYKILDGTKVGN